MSQHEPEASPQQQEAVRRLLAEARHDEPLPDDVAARLDRVLARLATEDGPAVDEAGSTGSTGPTEGVVVDLAARRRRRVTGLLGAAAAVVVLGVGIGQVIERADSGAHSTRDDSADGMAAREEHSGGQADRPGDGEPPSAAGAQPAPEGTTPLPDTVPRVGTPDFKQTVLRLREGAAVTSPTDGTAYTAADLTTEPLFVCPPTVLGVGRMVPVTFVGSPAVLAYRPPTGDTQVVELLQCGTGEVLRSVVVPAP
ncbi:hypothetical protein [Nocardioides plantarum]|uniref:Uncharacterized protein n=1 Tax=Nocardioides plantarum TaxID=29299 RepID=A0ABV5KFB8_9ACTN|nr:hypothetical protein [Nocardioides plantarum]